MKGIILAGGSGTRLYPLTTVTSKQLLPVYDKPMIYYPLSVLMMAGIRDILIISTPHDLPNFQRLLGDGSHYGVRFSYKVQPSPDGLAQAFLLGEEFIDGEPCALVLGDNSFYGNGLGATLRGAVRKAENGGGATVFGYYVDDPERYGVVEFNENKKAISIMEKPEHPASNYAVTGLYFYDERVTEFAKQIKPSPRGELEITDLNRMYLDEGRLHVRTLGRGYAWLDTGTMDSLFEAGEFVRTVQRAQGLPIAIVEEIAYENGWITREQLLESARRYGKSPYGKHLQDIADGNILLVSSEKEAREERLLLSAHVVLIFLIGALQIQLSSSNVVCVCCGFVRLLFLHCRNKAVLVQHDIFISGGNADGCILEGVFYVAVPV